MCRGQRTTASGVATRTTDLSVYLSRQFGIYKCVPLWITLVYMGSRDQT